MVQVTKSVIATLDEFYTPYSKSQCRYCKFLIDGHCYMTCEKYPDGFSAKLWNNKKNCQYRQPLTDKTE